METVFVVMSNMAYCGGLVRKVFKDKIKAEEYANEQYNLNDGIFYYTVDEVEIE